LFFNIGYYWLSRTLLDAIHVLAGCLIGAGALSSHLDLV
jgi:hypothetical protein